MDAATIGDMTVETTVENASIAEIGPKRALGGRPLIYGALGLAAPYSSRRFTWRSSPRSSR